jgi:hypothetical protein
MSSDGQNMINGGHANSNDQEKGFAAVPASWTVRQEITSADDILIAAELFFARHSGERRNPVSLSSSLVIVGCASAHHLPRPANCFRAQKKAASLRLYQ